MGWSRYEHQLYSYSVLHVRPETEDIVEVLAEMNNATVANAAFDTARHIRTQAVIQLRNGARIMRTEWTADVADKRPPLR